MRLVISLSRKSLRDGLQRLAQYILDAVVSDLLLPMWPPVQVWKLTQVQEQSRIVLSILPLLFLVIP